MSIENVMINKKQEDRWLLLLLLCTLPMACTLIIGIVILGTLGSVESSLIDVAAVWVSMIISFVVIPWSIVKSKYFISAEKIGIVKEIHFVDVFCLMATIIVVYWFHYNYQLELFWYLVFQTIMVAVAEEIWARGILTHYLRQLIASKWLILIMTSCIFAFVTHMNEPFLDNLIWRLPGGLLLGFVYMKTGRLYLSIIIHFGCNIVAMYI